MEFLLIASKLFREERPVGEFEGTSLQLIFALRSVRDVRLIHTNVIIAPDVLASSETTGREKKLRGAVMRASEYVHFDHKALTKTDSLIACNSCK